MYLKAGGRLGREADSAAQDSADTYPYKPSTGIMAAIYGLGGTIWWKWKSR
jgi:hypothetical protein